LTQSGIHRFKNLLGLVLILFIFFKPSTYHLGYSTALTCCSQSSENRGQNDHHAPADDDEGGRVEVLEFVDDVHSKANRSQAKQLSIERGGKRLIEKLNKFYFAPEVIKP